MKTQEIRHKFLKYFESKGHTPVASSSLIPAHDPTLLFTNAGMVQFKDVFLGSEKREYSRAVTVQRCVRAGGKHNDLEQVGYTARHHTFFEMLGNFSFGDYFKREAIRYSWDFLTQEMKLSPEKLWITVFEKDHEAADIWLKEIKINPQRFSRCGERDNFWAMGDTGPCGPCSEIFYDHGPNVMGGPPGSVVEGDRYTEIWNLVFMQYSRDESGHLTPLARPSIDTGMGLERLAAVMQGVQDNYDIDIFRYLLNAAKAQLEVAQTAMNSPEIQVALKVIADHIRCCAFLVKDGVIPSNEGRGYVLRRIIRRAIRYGKKISNQPKTPFFYKLVQPLVDVMGDAYPELRRSQSQIEKVLLREEEQFERTLQQGLRVLEECLLDRKTKVISGDIAFKLYDTYGFPLDLTELIAKERGYSVDESGFDVAMNKQRKSSRELHRFQANYQANDLNDFSSQFVGYDTREQSSKILAFMVGDQLVNSIPEGGEGFIILDKTPFYPESGGQVGDQGALEADDALFKVAAVKKIGQVILHRGKMITGAYRVGDQVIARVDLHYRNNVQLNHSATHLLHSALRQVLGKHVVQKGSLVEAERLRFDFSHLKPLTSQEIILLEENVNQSIRDNYKINSEIMSYPEAVKKGAMALFEEKYGERVRVVSMGHLSMELCGGTHASYTGDLGLFKIVAEESIAAGVRRIEALTGSFALNYVNQKLLILQKISEIIKTDQESIPSKLLLVFDHQRELEHQIVQFQKGEVKRLADTLAEQAEKVKDVYVVIQQVQGMNSVMLREVVDQLKNQLQSAVILLASCGNNTIYLVAGVTHPCLNRCHAGELVKMVSEKVGGKGGGRADMAQGGGKLIQFLPEALISIKEWTKQKI